MYNTGTKPTKIIFKAKNKIKIIFTFIFLLIIHKLKLDDVDYFNFEGVVHSRTKKCIFYS